jgi:hypothetical protein
MSTGYNTLVSAAGTSGAASQTTLDSITFGGGSKIGHGVALLTLNEVLVRS